MQCRSTYDLKARIIESMYTPHNIIIINQSIEIEKITLSRVFCDSYFKFNNIVLIHSTRYFPI